MEAYSLYLRGLYLANRLLIAEAVEVFEQAFGKDPNFATAHAALAYQYALLGYNAIMRPREAYTIASRYANHATDLRPSLPNALFAKGWISTFYDWDWIGAERYLKFAIAGNQNTGASERAKNLNGPLHLSRTLYHADQPMGRPAGAEAETAPYP
jgi:tetratricopeptide (TPR) repeat protein